MSAAHARREVFGSQVFVRLFARQVFFGKVFDCPVIFRQVFSRLRRFATLASLALLLIAVAPRLADAAPLDVSGDDWEGLSQFARMAEAEVGSGRFAAPRTLPLDRLEPGDALILVHPEQKLPAQDLASFMRAGGRIVLLDDYGTGDILLEHFGIRRVPLPAHPAEMLRGMPSFAIAEPVSAHPAVRDVAQVVTNHATGLSDTGLLPLLSVSGRFEPDVLLAVAGIVGKGRFLAVGDPSIVMNAMLRYPGNRALAAALVKVAAEEPAPAVSDAGVLPGGKLYLVANDCAWTGHFRDKTEPPYGAFAQARRLLGAAAEAADSLRHGVSAAAAYAVAVGLGVLLIAWTTSRAVRTHRRASPRFVRPIPVVAQGGVAGHAAVLGAPGTARILAVLEMKTALEEQILARLGRDRQGRTPPASELVAQARAASLLDARNAEALGKLLASFARYEAMLLHKHPAGTQPVREREVSALAAGVQALVGVMDANAKRRGTLPPTL